MRYTVRDIYDAVDALAPFETAEPWDNVGLLIGGMDRPVDTVLTALDATPQVVREARERGAQLLLTHHPLLFAPVRRLDEAEPGAALVCDIIRAGLSMIAAHTNLDVAVGGVNDALAESLGLAVAETDGILRLGSLGAPVRLDALAQRIESALAAPVTRYGQPACVVSRFALCSGAGGAEVARAAAQGAQVLITGELKHDQALDAMARGLCVLAAGHRATEICAADLLARHLLSALNTVESKIRVFVSESDPFG